jgi:hypothetical protein
VTNARSAHKESTATTDSSKVTGDDLAGTGIHGPRDALSREPVATVAIKTAANFEQEVLEIVYVELYICITFNLLFITEI